MQFASLGSGSKGNATLVRAVSGNSHTQLMVDCGFSIKETCSRLELLGVSPDGIDAILVTHEHSDHIRGVAPFARRYGMPVYASRGTAKHFQQDNIEVKTINVHRTVTIGNIEIKPVPVPHDAREPCQYVFTANDLCFGQLTDIGSLTSHVVESYANCDALLLEFNHDSDMLANSHYPAGVRQRVAGDLGHLNNLQAREMLEHLLPGNLRLIVAGHLSESNNKPEIVEQVLSEAVSQYDCQYALANQHKTSDWYQLAELC